MMKEEAQSVRAEQAQVSFTATPVAVAEAVPAAPAPRLGGSIDTFPQTAFVIGVPLEPTFKPPVDVVDGTKVAWLVSPSSTWSLAFNLATLTSVVPSLPRAAMDLLLAKLMTPEVDELLPRLNMPPARPGHAPRAPGPLAPLA